MIDAVPVRSNPVAPPIAILGIPLDNLSAARAIECIEAMVESRRPHYLVTANVDFLVQAQEDEELRRILIDADLVLCDGTPLVWASRVLGNPLPERVAGADLVPQLIGVAARKGYRIFLLGATPASAAKAVANLQTQYPDLLITGHYSPPFNPLLEMDHDEISRRILEAAPDLLFVSLGCPKQEKWLAMHYRSLGVPVSIGVGATIDFLAGEMKRAPVWMQRAGVEWIFRLAQEPRRLFKRYARDLSVFGARILAQWWRLQFRRQSIRPGTTKPSTMQASAAQWITVRDRLDIAAVRDGVLPVEKLVADGRHCLLEMSKVSFVDSTGIGLLVRLQKQFRACGRFVVLVAPSSTVRRALSLMRIESLFSSVPDFPSAQRLIEARTREQATLVTQRTAAAANPILWQGEITAANAEQAWEMTRARIVSAYRQKMVIDLSGVRFLDSSGVGVMVRARKLAERTGVALSFVNLSPCVRNVLQLSRLEEFLLQPRTPVREHAMP